MNVFHQFPQLLRDLGITPRHLVHVGAHEGQEMPWYREAGVPQVTLVEPIPELAERLRARFPDVRVVECACDAEPGTAVLHVMEPSNVSTLLDPQVDPGTGKLDRPTGRDIQVQVRTLAEIAPDAQIAVVDAQGVELEVLRGAPWDSLELVIVEACTVPDRTIASPYWEVIAFAESIGWVEAGYWSRDYRFIVDFARGRTRGRARDAMPQGEVRDVILVRRPS